LEDFETKLEEVVPEQKNQMIPSYLDQRSQCSEDALEEADVPGFQNVDADATDFVEVILGNVRVQENEFGETLDDLHHCLYFLFG
jgi:hypothetical protein